MRCVGRTSIVPCFQLSCPLAKIVQQSGCKGAADHVSRRGLYIDDATQPGLVHGVGLHFVGRQHHDIEIAVARKRLEEFIKGGVNLFWRSMPSEIVFENDAVLVGRRQKGLHRQDMTLATSEVATRLVRNGGDADDFAVWDAHFGHFRQEFLFAVLSVVQVDIINNVHMGPYVVVQSVDMSPWLYNTQDDDHDENHDVDAQIASTLSQQYNFQTLALPTSFIQVPLQWNDTHDLPYYVIRGICWGSKVLRWVVNTGFNYGLYDGL